MDNYQIFIDSDNIIKVSKFRSDGTKLFLEPSIDIEKWLDSNFLDNISNLNINCELDRIGVVYKNGNILFINNAAEIMTHLHKSNFIKAINKEYTKKALKSIEGAKVVKTQYLKKIGKSVKEFAAEHKIQIGASALLMAVIVPVAGGINYNKNVEPYALVHKNEDTSITQVSTENHSETTKINYSFEEETTKEKAGSSYLSAEPNEVSIFDPLPATTTIKSESTTKETTTIKETTKPVETLAPTETTTKETTTETTLAEIATKKPTTDNDYISDPADGFVVTTGNKTYSISNSDYDLMCAVVAHEAGPNPNEALAVASVILNRCDSGAWGGTTPRDVIVARGQFESYFAGYYKQYLNGKAPQTVKDAVTDALNGVRNNKYESFRSAETYSYSDNMLTKSGNRYK